MKLLIDNALSPSVAVGLSQAGHDAVHVRDRGLRDAPDERVLALALEEDRIVVSADTDFGALLALRGVRKPSFILFRGVMNRRPERQIAVLLPLLETFRESLQEGCIVVIEEKRVRLRTLPVAEGGR